MSKKEYLYNEAHSAYCFVGNHFKWKVDAVYEDAIIDLVGTNGLNLMRKFNLVEPCGSINGRKLYTM